MEWMDWYIYGVFAILFVALLLVWIPAMAERIIYQGSYGRDRQMQFEAVRNEHGYQAAMDDLFLKEAMARYRRVASEKVRANPKNFLDELDAGMKDAFEFVQMQNPDLLPAFGQMIKGLPYNHILYAEETRLVDSLIKPPQLNSIDIDRIISVRRARPG